MEVETLKQKTAKGLFWGGISNGVQQLLGVLFGIYLARTLNAEDYGLVGMLAIFSGIAGTVINSGFTVALTNKTDATHKDYNAVFWFTFFVGLVCYVVLYFAAPLIAKFYNRPELTSLSRVIFVSFFVSGCAAVSYTVLFKRLMVKQQAQIDISSMVLSGLVGVTMAVKGYGYWALAMQNVTFICSGALLRFWFAPWKPTLDFNFNPLKGMLSFSLNLFFMNIFGQINGNLISVFLGKYYNATQLGYYSQGQKWAGMGQNFIIGMMNSVSQPVLVEVRHNIERQKNVLRKMLRFGAFISFSSFIGLAFIAKEFILVTIGEKWLPCVSILQLFCLWGAVAFIWNLYSNLLMTHGRSDLIFKGNVIVGILQFVIVFFLFKWGITLMVIGYVSTYYIGIAFFHYYVVKILNLTLIELLKDIVPYLVISFFCCLIMTIFISFLENEIIVLLFKMFGFGGLYLLFSYLAGSALLKDIYRMFVIKKIN